MFHCKSEKFSFIESGTEHISFIVKGKAIYFYWNWFTFALKHSYINNAFLVKNLPRRLIDSENYNFFFYIQFSARGIYISLRHLNFGSGHLIKKSWGILKNETTNSIKNGFLMWDKGSITKRYLFGNRKCTLVVLLTAAAVVTEQRYVLNKSFILH